MHVDMSVKHPNSEHQAVIMDKMISSLGFSVVFSNLHITSKTQSTKKEIADMIELNKKRSGSIPIDYHSTSTIVKNVLLPGEQYKYLTILNRVTFVMQNNDNIDSLCKSLFPSLSELVDCFVIRPANENQLMELVSKREQIQYDFLSIDVSTGNFINQFGAVIKSLKPGHVAIELELAPCMSQLGNAVSQCRNGLNRVTCCFLSSGAKSAMELRSPLDLTNWATGVFQLCNSEKNAAHVIDSVFKKRVIRSNFP